MFYKVLCSQFSLSFKFGRKGLICWCSFDVCKSSTPTPSIHTWFWGVVCFLWSVNITCRIFPSYKLQIFGGKCIKCLFTLKSLRFGGAFDLSWEASGSYTVCICIVYHTIQLCTACKLGIMRFQNCTIQYHYCTALQDWKHKRKIPPSYESSSLGPYPQRFGISDL